MLADGGEPTRGPLAQGDDGGHSAQHGQELLEPLEVRRLRALDADAHALVAKAERRPAFVACLHVRGDLGEMTSGSAPGRYPRARAIVFGAKASSPSLSDGAGDLATASDILEGTW